MEMEMAMRSIYKTAVAVSVLACAAFAQDEVQVKKMMVELQQQLATAKIDAVAAGSRVGVMTVVKNAPYAADQITENTQVLGDGTRIHSESKVTITRDSQGRVRRETPDYITIWDPVENVTYGLNPKTMGVSKTRVFARMTGDKADTERRMTLAQGDAVFVGGGFGTAGGPQVRTIVVDGGQPPAGVAQMKMAQAADMAAADGAKARLENASHESLGSQRMEGVSAEGTRETSTIEAGAIGNDRPISVVSERWYSSELQTEVMTRHSDPRSGERVVRLTNIRLGEPDPSLFQVPASYQQIGDMPPLPPLLKKDR
jgi:hypothetical protein